MLSVGVSAWLMERQERIADRELADGVGEAHFLAMKAAAANFYRLHIVPEAIGLKSSVMSGASLLYSVDEAALTA